MQTSPLLNQETQNPKEWWRYGHVWLVISGPLAVIIACVITFAFVVDPEVSDTYYKSNAEAKPDAQGKQQKELLPAQHVRNHAATPDKDIPAPRK